MFDKLTARLHDFLYNFSWSDYHKLLNGLPARFSLAFPIVGYAILFNDFFAQKYDFTELTGQVKTHLLLSPEKKLRSSFIGLMLFAGANVFYLLRRPWIMRHGETQIQFNRTADELFTFGDLSNLHYKIRGSGYDPLTRDGKYYDQEWDAFANDCTGPLFEKKDPKMNTDQFRHEISRRGFVEAKSRHASLIRSILNETYFRECTKRQNSLLFCVIVASIGYLLVIIPSIDLALVVLYTTF